MMEQDVWQQNTGAGISLLPPRLVRRLRELSRKYRAEGLSLFIFGSFAQSRQRPTSDLDLGVEWREEPRPEVFLRLYWDVQELPTVRRMDLVDFSQTSSEFSRVAGENRIYLTGEGDDDDEEKSSQGQP